MQSVLNVCESPSKQSMRKEAHAYNARQLEHNPKQHIINSFCDLLFVNKYKYLPPENPSETKVPPAGSPSMFPQPATHKTIKPDKHALHQRTKLLAPDARMGEPPECPLHSCNNKRQKTWHFLFAEWAGWLEFIYTIL